VGREAGTVAGHIGPAAGPGRAAAVRCVRAAQEVRLLLDALEAATTPLGWSARGRTRLAAVRRRIARSLRTRVPSPELTADVRAPSSSELSA
jgi:hypothetical protein